MGEQGKIDKRSRPRSDKIKILISEKNIATWEKKLKMFLMKNPKCTECGGAFNHYSRTMVCRDCQKIKNNKSARAIVYAKEYRKRHKKRIQGNQKTYYQVNKESIKMRTYYRKERFKEGSECVVEE